MQFCGIDQCDYETFYELAHNENEFMRHSNDSCRA